MGIDGFCLIFIPVLLFLCKLHIMKKVNVQENALADAVSQKDSRLYADSADWTFFDEAGMQVGRKRV